MKKNTSVTKMSSMVWNNGLVRRIGHNWKNVEQLEKMRHS